MKRRSFFGLLGVVCSAALVLQDTAMAAELVVPEGVTFTKDVEYSNPDDQHLQVNVAQPKGDGPFPAVVCIHGGGFPCGET